MDSNIKRADIDMLRKLVKAAEPYDFNDDEYRLYDSKGDSNRTKATDALYTLQKLGIDPYDDNDYGEY